MGSHGGDDRPQLPPPTLWPVGFAIGIAVLLVGLVVSPLLIAPIGGAIAIVFGYLWIRDATASLRTPVHVEPERREVADTSSVRADEGEPASPLIGDEEIDAFPRSKFLEGATLGVGALIGGLITVPVIGFAVAPAFVGQHSESVDLGPTSNFEEGKFVVATFMLDPKQGEVTRRTVYVRNNGLTGKVPSFTILSNRCAHLGCPVQPNGPIFDKQQKLATLNGQEVRLIPSQPAGFGCPCHGGQYDTEGNRVAGPPVRALDRYEFSIRNGNLWLGRTFSVGKVDGAGASAKIHKYKLAGPGEHVDGPEQLLYPLQPPH